MNKFIKPGEAWNDTDNNPIQAHGGSIIFLGDTYYFYGENKDKTFVDSDYWYNGVNCYSSKDLINWRFEDTILKPSEDPESPLHFSKKCDRPHILFNDKTNKFVMWIKVMGDDPTGKNDINADLKQFMCIATSDKITGPFEFVKKIYPVGMYSGDFDLYKDPVDGKAYIIFGRPHTEIIIADLTDDYLDVTGNYSSHFHHPGPIAAREAPCVFRKKQKFYMLTSGTAGYFPNPSEMAVADAIHGPWTVLGNPCIDDDYNDSFNNQFSCVFKVEGKDLFIALGDRWLNGTPIEMAAVGKMNTALARYVWLPITWDDDFPKIKWLDKWSISDYPDEKEIDLVEEIKLQMQPLIPSILKRKEEEQKA